MPLTKESALRKDKITAQGAELQHRHFAFIAATLARTAPSSRDRGAEKWRQIVEAFADDCARSNPRFDRRRFMIACAAVAS